MWKENPGYQSAFIRLWLTRSAFLFNTGRQPEGQVNGPPTGIHPPTLLVSELRGPAWSTIISSVGKFTWLPAHLASRSIQFPL